MHQMYRAFAISFGILILKAHVAHADLSPTEYHRQYCANFTNEMACTRDIECNWGRHGNRCVPRCICTPDYGRSPWPGHSDGDGCRDDHGRSDWDYGRGRDENRYDEMCGGLYSRHECELNNYCQWELYSCRAKLR